MDTTTARQIDRMTPRDASASGPRELTESELVHLVGGSGDVGSGEPDEALKASPILF